MTADTEELAPEELSARHLAFKEKAVEVAHKYAADEGHCATFDAILHELGLPGRQSFYQPGCDDGCCPPNRVPPVLVGEETEAEFNAWKYKTAKALRCQAQRHGIYSAGPAMIQAGFPSEEELAALTKTVDVQIDGTFKLNLHVETIDGVNLIEFVDATEVLRSLRRDWNTDNVTWKATIADHQA